MTFTRLSSEPFLSLASCEYLGRTLMLGLTASGEERVIVYALTGRSPSSQARILERTSSGALRTQVTDPEILQRGNPSLLLYDCIVRHHETFLVSNGSQTDLLAKTAQNLRVEGGKLSPLNVLVRAHQRPHWVEGNVSDSPIDLTLYEPDAPTYTPRICGVMGVDEAAFSISKCVHSAQAGQPRSAVSFFKAPLQPGFVSALSTYTGRNVPSGEMIPSFGGDPIQIPFSAKNPEEMAKQVYGALGPKAEAEGILRPNVDFRVAVAVMWIHQETHTIRCHIINRKELET